ncbi:MAG: DUF805 domain-containing protein [Armatimonas sp.]
MNWYLQVLNKYAVFGGRARRAEFWYFVLFNGLFAYVLRHIDASFGHHEDGEGFLSGLYSLFIFLPSLAVSVRRLHDIGRSAWWLLCYLIPIAGWIILLVLHLQDSDPGSNEYGRNPKL